MYLLAPISIHLLYAPLTHKRQSHTGSGVCGLPLGEGLAVCALVHRGVALVGADLDLAQGAVVLGVAVMLAGSDRAGDTFIGFAVHKKSSYFFGIDSVCPRKGKNISPRPGNFSRHTRHCTRALQAFDPRLYLAAQQASRCKRTQRVGDCMKFFPLKIISIHLNYFKTRPAPEVRSPGRSGPGSNRRSPAAPYSRTWRASAR